jgi:transcription-repair coupling factor (superfamily II helicase)
MSRFGTSHDQRMNISGLLEIFNQLPAFQGLLAELDSDRNEGGGPRLLGLPPGARPPVLASLFAVRQRPMLFVTGRVENVPIWQQALEAWLPPGVDLLRFPEPTPLPYERAPWSERSRNQRLAVLARLMAGQHPLLPTAEKPLLILTSARALMQKSLPKRRFAAATRVIKVGQLVNLEKLVEGWLAAGYEPVSVVESQGQFSRRGGILDIFPPGMPYPVRIELFGDEVETLRAFDPATQRTIEVADAILTAGSESREPEAGDRPGGPQLSHVVISPAREAMPGDLRPVGQRLQAEAQPKASDLPDWQDDIPELAAGALSPHLEFYLPLAYSHAATLLDYLPDTSWVVAEDLAGLEQAAAELQEHARQIAGEQPDLPADSSSPLVDWPEVQEAMSRRPFLVLGGGPNEQVRASSELAEAFQPGPRYGGQMRPLMIFLGQARREGERTVVVSQQVQRLAELWREANRSGNGYGLPGHEPVNSLEFLPPAGTITFVQGSLASGFTLEQRVDISPDRGQAQDKILLNFLSDAEIFGWSRPAPRRRGKPRPIAPEAYYADISPGDYVVHLEFGIGRFIGLVVRNIGGMEREYLQVRFANSDVLYVPVHHADRLSKWIGPDDRTPQLHRLGEKSWKRTKAKAQEAIDELADELLDLYATRETIAGHAFGADTLWQAELEASFPYIETDAQPGPWTRSRQTWSSPGPWIASSAATWAMARRKWPCGQPSRRSWTASRWPSSCPPPCWPSSITRPLASASAPSRFRGGPLPVPDPQEAGGRGQEGVRGGRRHRHRHPPAAV